jgi:tRNA 5-methylaminomethyl-2-thiouridine biosynthesis bifunctional protein
MPESARSAARQGGSLTIAWTGLAAWRILAFDFGSGLDFLATWRAWQEDPQRPRLLHYVALTAEPVSAEALVAGSAADPVLLALARQLSTQWHGLKPGFHRLTLEDGQLLLTLCVGETTALLRQQAFVADAVYLGADKSGRAPEQPWDSWRVKALARCCRRGTRLSGPPTGARLRADLMQCGFELQRSANDQPTDALLGVFNPRWELKQTRKPAPASAPVVGNCAVIGAGLAGASVAAALARRGWQVQVLDQGTAPSAGASGLPVGLVVPHVSVDDCTLSRLSRAGVRLMLQQARSLLQPGQDWDESGTLERRLDGDGSLPDLWHARAAWIKPAALVRAWLTQPNIAFHSGSQVASVRRGAAHWELLDAQNQLLCRADRVVFANAMGALPLIEQLHTRSPERCLSIKRLPALQGVHGQLSWGLHPGTPDAGLPQFPVNGAGSVIPKVPTAAGLAWFVGSTYQPERLKTLGVEANHAANLERLLRLLPDAGSTLAPQFASVALQDWSNTRCVSADRLPVVGPLDPSDAPGLWICAAMGSRGLSFSMLCAELLAARWGGEPLPLPSDLARALDARRVAARVDPDLSP